MPFDHELKLGRSLKHLQDLDFEIKSWLSANHYSVRYEFDLGATSDDIPFADIAQGRASWLEGPVFLPGQNRDPLPEGTHWSQDIVTALATAEQPPTDPISLLIGDALHNMRSALDALAYALAVAFTQPLPEEVADSSEFPSSGIKTARERLALEALCSTGEPTRDFLLEGAGCTKPKDETHALKQPSRGCSRTSEGTASGLTRCGSGTTWTESVSIASCTRPLRALTGRSGTSSCSPTSEPSDRG
jgi:hypothetical protein